MNKRCLLWIEVITIVTSVCLTPMTLYAAPSTQEQLDEAQEAYEDTQDKLDEAQNSLETLHAQKDTLQGLLDDLTDKLGVAAGILEELDKNISDKREQIDNTWGELESLATQIEEIEALAEEQYEQTKAQIKYAYESGDTMYLILLAGSASYSDYINRNSYMQMFSKYQQEQLEKLAQTSESLKERKSEYENKLVLLEQEKEELDEYEDKVSEQHAEIAALVDDASGKMSRYADQIADTEARLRLYEGQIADQENDIANLKSKLEQEKKMTSQAAGAVWRDISDVSVAESDRKLLANIIWCEAGNEPYEGQVAVGAVVMNRVMSSVFPNTVTGVIYQKSQFTPASSGRLALALSKDSADENCYKAADAALNGVNNIGSCLYFRTPTSGVNPKYRIGGHIFY